MTGPAVPSALPGDSLREEGLVAAPEKTSRQTPAPRPECILVPPILATAASAAIVAALEASRAGWTAAPAVGAAAALCALLCVAAGISTLWALANGRRERQHFAAAAFAVLAVAGSATLFGMRLGTATLGLALVLSAASPFAWRRWQERWAKRRVERYSVLAATPLGAFEAIRRLESVPWVRIVSVLVPEGDPEMSSRLLRRPVAKAVRGGPRLERRVIVSSPVKDPAVGRSIAELVARGHDLTSESATIRTAEGRVDTSRADPLALLLGRPRSRSGDFASRVLDVVLSLALLIVAAPLLVALAVAIVLDDGFPVFYRQRRVGTGGRHFDVIKFRSMRRDAEAASGPVWATAGDPRVTRVGRFLRRFRLDELPQLGNVLVGQMALVGPRPERPHFCDVLRASVPLFELRTAVRPGLTGWAQVRLAYGASADDAREKLEYDLYYVTRRSPWLDLAILAETARVVLTGSGSR